MRRTALCVLATSLLLTTSAFASGYGLREFSASTLGLSYAGSAANGETASTLAFNPALLADVKDWDAAASGIGILPNTSGSFTGTTAAGTPLGTSTPHGIVNTALVPDFSLRYRLSDEFVVGVVTSSPWGMVTNYGPSWVGRYYATYSDVKTYNVTPMVSWQPVPEFAIGVGVQVQYLNGRLGKAIDFGTIGCSINCMNPLGTPFFHVLPGQDDGSVLLKAQDWTEGFVVGVTWKPTPDWSFGASYRSRLDGKMKGTETFTLDGAGVGATLNAVYGMFANSTASAVFDNPDVFTVGARWHINDQWTALAGGDWTGWSAFKTLTAHATNPHQPDDVSDMNWKDSWFGSLGVEYQACQDLILRLGTAYDESPTVDEFRTPGIPDNSRYWVSGGFGYQFTDHMGVDFSIARLIAEKADINLLASDPGNSSRGWLQGVVHMGVTLVGVEFTYRQ
jgi:long-chain fatty acid transport protein